ncbi:MAG: glycerol-3-phosphate 1-O-acyltransferase PlsY [Phycisphaerales bacterium]
MCAASFAAGSIPFGLLLARAKGVDLRATGSGNIGATNVGRALGRKWGVVVYFLDAAKGALPVLLAGWLSGALGANPAHLPASTQWWWLAVAICAVLGHMYTPLAGFRGGKGVATGSGALMAIYPVLTLPVLVAVAMWMVCLLALRIMSVAGMAAGVTVPAALVTMAVLHRPPGSPPMDALQPIVPSLVVSVLVAVLVIWKHRSNIARIRAGTEPRVSLGFLSAGRNHKDR